METAATEVQEQETQDVSELTDSELNAQLGETSETENKAETADPVTEKKKVSEKKENAPVAQETVSIPKTEYETMQKRISDKETMIARQGTEIGQLRKRLTSEIEALKSSLTFDNLAENTSQVLQNAEVLKEKEHQLNRVAEYEAHLGKKTLVDEVLPNLSELHNEMAEILDSEDKVWANKFRENPYVLEPATTYNLAKRAELNLELKKLRAENDALKGKSEQVIKNIENAAKQKPTITGKSASGKDNSTAIAPEQISDLSDTELDELLKQKTKGG